MACIAVAGALTPAPGVAAAGGPPPALTAGRPAAPEQATTTPASSEDNAVSCPGTTACMAVGSYAVHANQVVDVAMANLWNGSSWSQTSVPSPAGAIDGYLDGVACTASSACAAAGYYATPTGATYALTERWTGYRWQLVPSPDPRGSSSNYLDSLACSDLAHCMAVGTYTDSQSTEVPLAERWDGTRWALVTAPAPPGAYASVLQSVACPSPSLCVAVGYAINAASAEVTLAEAWNGSVWSVLATPNPPHSQGSVLDGISCVSVGACAAVGSTTGGSGQIAPLSEFWNGSSWFVRPTAGLGRDPYAILSSASCPAAGDCWAVGRLVNTAGALLALVEHWNGRAWQQVASPDPSASTSLSGVSCPSSVACLAAGSYTNGAGNPATLAEVWDGTTWSVANRDLHLNGVSCARAAICLAVGAGLGASQVEQAWAGSWNGSGWTPTPVPGPPGARGDGLGSVSCPSPTGCVAVGYYISHQFAHLGLAESWNGHSWAYTPSPNPPGSLSTALNGVSCAGADACMAVGASSGFLFAERWNGALWTITPTPLPATSIISAFNAVSCVSPSSCTAVGYYTSTQCGGCDRTLAEHWDGSAWSIDATPEPGINADFSTVACRRDRCTALGDYQAPSGRYLALAARSSGTTWTRTAVLSPGGSPYTQLSGVSCSAAGTCTSVGNYLTSGGNYLTLTERWSGTAWSITSSPNPPAKPPTITYLSSVSCLGPYCLAGGSAGDPANAAGLTELWNGSRWEIGVARPEP